MLAICMKNNHARFYTPPTHTACTMKKCMMSFLTSFKLLWYQKHRYRSDITFYPLTACIATSISHFDVQNAHAQIFFVSSLAANAITSKEIPRHFKSFKEKSLTKRLKSFPPEKDQDQSPS